MAEQEQLQFSVGDRVVHPGIGAGRITGTRRQELVEGFERYYVVEIPSRESTVFVPMCTADKLGLRPVMSRTKLNSVLDTLSDTPHTLPEGYKERQEQVRDKLRTGRPILVAEVVRDLTWLDRVARLTRKDSDLLARGRTFLASEMALVMGIDVDEVIETIDEALTLIVPGTSD